MAEVFSKYVFRNRDKWGLAFELNAAPLTSGEKHFQGLNVSLVFRVKELATRGGTLQHGRNMAHGTLSKQC